MVILALCTIIMYSKACLKRPLKKRQNKGLKTNGSLMKVESVEEYSPFCYAHQRKTTLSSSDTLLLGSFQNGNFS